MKQELSDKQLIRINSGDKSKEFVVASKNESEKTDRIKTISIKQKMIAASHSGERFIDRSIDKVVCSVGVGLTLRSLTQKALK